MSHNDGYESDESGDEPVTEHRINGDGGLVYWGGFRAFFEEVAGERADGSTMLRLSDGKEKLALELYANVGFLEGLEDIIPLLERQGKLETINSERLIEEGGIYTTALFTAALWNREACVKILIRAGATIKACSSWELWMEKFESWEEYKDILKLLEEQLEKEKKKENV